MANPEMWKLADETRCDFGVTCGNRRPIQSEEMYDDPGDAAQVGAGEEDQSAPGWEGI